MTEREYPEFFMPLNANIPNEWIRRDMSTIYETVIAFPGWSDIPVYYVRMNNETRKLSCDERCKGFKFNHKCHHLPFLIFSCHKPAKRRGGVQTNSLNAFMSFDSETLSAHRRSVYNAIADMGKATDKKTAEYLGWAINRVTPRRGELRDDGVIAKWGDRWDENTKAWETVWFCTRQLVK